MATIQDLRRTLEEFEGQHESHGYDLRLSLAQLVIRRMAEMGWSQKKLAEAAQMKPSFLSRIIHSDQNCTFDVAGRLLYALSVRARIEEAVSGTERQTIVTSRVIYRAEVNTYEQETTASEIASTAVSYAWDKEREFQRSAAGG